MHLGETLNFRRDLSFQSAILELFDNDIYLFVRLKKGMETLKKGYGSWRHSSKKRIKNCSEYVDCGGVFMLLPFIESKMINLKLNMESYAAPNISAWILSFIDLFTISTADYSTSKVNSQIRCSGNQSYFEVLLVLQLTTQKNLKL